MLRKFAAFALAALAAACTAVAPVATPPPVPTAVTVTFAVSTVTVLPTVTVSVTRTPSVTVVPTPDVPIREMHPVARALGTINVLEAYCYSTTTTILLFDYGMRWIENEAARKACVAKGQVA